MKKLFNFFLILFFSYLFSGCDEDEISTELNTSFKNILENNKKITTWIFGHTNQNFHVRKNNSRLPKRCM